jgi:NitT/TauT family transport system permease protein
MKQKFRHFLTALIVPIAIILIWYFIIWSRDIPAYMLPSPWLVLKAVIKRHDDLLASFLITAEEAAGGLIASIIAGVAIALCFAQSRWLRRTFIPYTILLQTVPIIAVSPLIINWFGFGLNSVLLIAFIICLPPIIANTTQGLIGVEENLVQLFTMHNATRAQVLFKLRLPHALPSLFTGIRISAGISLIGAITGELFAGSTHIGQGGLGYSILYAMAQVETDYLYALIAACAVLGFTFFFLTLFAEWYALHNWHESARTFESPEK